MGRLALLAAACVLASGSWMTAAAHAEAPPQAVSEVDPIDIPPDRDPLRHAFRHLEERGGFYLRLSTTLGYQTTRLGPASWEGETENVRAEGFGTAFGLDIGGFVAPWLALHLDATAGLLWNGDIDHEFGFADQDDSVRIAAYGFAPAATFFLPHSFFVKTAFGVGLATIKREGHDATTNPGFYMDLVGGNDLYRDEHVSFGIQMQIIYMRLGADSKANEARVQQYLWGFSLGFDSL